MSQRLPRIALGAALLALALVGVALLVTMRRGGARGTPLIARPMHARDVVRLTASTVERTADGVHVQPAVAAALGLAPSDTLIAISGVPITRPHDIELVSEQLEDAHAVQWFVELSRDGARVIERWDLEGDVHAARRERWAMGDIDPLRATIKRLGATQFQLPRATLSAWIAAPSRLLVGVGSWSLSGNGYKLQAVNPGAVALALGLEDGDLICAINGVEIAPLDSVASIAPMLSSADQLTLDIRRGGAPLLLNYLIR